MDTIIFAKVAETLNTIYISEFEKMMNQTLASEICILLDSDIAHDEGFEAVKDLIHTYYDSASVGHATQAIFYAIGLGSFAN